MAEMCILFHYLLPKNVSSDFRIPFFVFILRAEFSYQVFVRIENNSRKEQHLLYFGNSHNLSTSHILFCRTIAHSNTFAQTATLTWYDKALGTTPDLVSTEHLFNQQNQQPTAELCVCLQSIKRTLLLLTKPFTFFISHSSSSSSWMPMRSAALCEFVENLRVFGVSYETRQCPQLYKVTRHARFAHSVARLPIFEKFTHAVFGFGKRAAAASTTLLLFNLISNPIQQRARLERECVAITNGNGPRNVGCAESSSRVTKKRRVNSSNSSSSIGQEVGGFAVGEMGRHCMSRGVFCVCVCCGLRFCAPARYP